MNKKLELDSLLGLSFEQLQKTKLWQVYIRPILIGSGYKVVKVEEDEKKL